MKMNVRSLLQLDAGNAGEQRSLLFFANGKNLQQGNLKDAKFALNKKKDYPENTI